MASFTDSFDRADSGSLGASWSNLAGTWEIVSNQARCSTGSPSQNTTAHDSGSSDVDVAVKVATVGNNGGMIARAADSNNYLVLVFGASAGGMVLYKRVGGGFTSIGSTGTAVATNDVVKLQGSGNTIKAFINGVEYISVTDSAGASNTQHGLREDSTTKCVYDDFSITDLAAAATSFPFRQRGSMRALLVR